MVVNLSAVGEGLRLARSEIGSRHDIVVTEPSSALNSSVKSDPTPDRTSSMSSCDTASPRAKMLLSVSLLRATRCKSSSHAFDIFFFDVVGDDGISGETGRGGGGGIGASGAHAGLSSASISAIVVLSRL